MRISTEFHCVKF